MQFLAWTFIAAGALALVTHPIPAFVLLAVGAMLSAAGRTSRG